MKRVLLENMRVLGFTLIVSMVSAVVLGTVPLIPKKVMPRPTKISGMTNKGFLFMDVRPLSSDHRDRGASSPSFAGTAPTAPV